MAGVGAVKAASLLLLALLGLCGLVEAADSSYAVRGVLISGKDGAVIPHGTLTAALAGTGAGERQRGRGGNAQSPAASTETDDKGGFMLALPGPGLWKLTASAPGFRAAALDEHDGYFTGVAVSPSTRSVEVTFRLAPDAEISGYVLDEAGEGVRNAQVTLFAASNSPEMAAWRRRSTVRADDRGYYEFSGLAPGRYQVAVQAQPWYAVAGPRGMGTGGSHGPVADSPLDVAYPLTWYPGVTDASGAGLISLEDGGGGQADVRLAPVPSLHLRVPAPSQNLHEQGGRVAPLPQVQLLWPEGSVTPQVLRPSFGPQGDLDVGGLAPGTYQITNLNGTSQPYVLHLGPGSARTIDLNAAVPTVAVTLIYDLDDGALPPQVELIDTATGQIASGEAGGNARLRPRSDPPRGEGPRFGDGPRFQDGRGGRTLNLAPGRYEVRLTNERGAFLTGLSASGAGVSGRFITVGSSDCQVTLHLAAGRATLTGVAMDGPLPVAGAMVLLVPTTWGDPQHFISIQRAQTNTDGGFRLTSLAPGQYILVAIDHGWHVQWSDPATLRPYLLHGVPVDLTTSVSAREIVPAQLP